MTTLSLRPRALSPSIARTLEEKGLVTFIRHPGLAVRRGLTKDWIKGEDFPASLHGFHSVSVTYTDIFLSSHPKGQDEIVFVWDAERAARPLFFVFALDTRDAYLRKLKAGTLTAGDYVAFRAPVNDPRLSSFVVHSGTVHCELTDRRGPRVVAPSFFVLEPRKLSVRYTEEKRHGLQLALA